MRPRCNRRGVKATARPAQKAGRPHEPSAGLGVAALTIEGTQESLPGVVEVTPLLQHLPQLGVKERHAGIQGGRALEFPAGPSQPLWGGLARQRFTERSVVDPALRILIDGRLKPLHCLVAAKRLGRQLALDPLRAPGCPVERGPALAEPGGFRSIIGAQVELGEGAQQLGVARIARQTALNLPGGVPAA